MHDGDQVRTSIVHHSGNATFAIRKGDWKLVLWENPGGFSNDLKIEGIPVDTDRQLYYLAKDPSEHTKLYAVHPEKVREIASLLDQYKAAGYSNH